MTTYAAGKDFLVKKGDGGAPEAFTTIAGMRQDAMTMNNAPIDVTNKDNPQWRKIIAGGIKSMSITLSGVVNDHATVKALRSAAMSKVGGDIINFQLVNGLGQIYQGPFFVAGFDEGGDEGKEGTYSLKLENSDEITYTEAP